jgi:inosine/xanthosine triphosphatase
VPKTIFAIGSTSEPKVGALREALAKLDIAFEVRACSASSGVAAQPVGLEEMFRGACHRALQAIKEEPGATFGIGIESGLLYLPSIDEIDMHNIGVRMCDAPAIAVVSREGELVSWGVGETLPLPAPLALDALTSELGDAVIKRGQIDKDPVALMTAGEKRWRDSLASALYNTLLPAVRSEQYE